MKDLPRKSPLAESKPPLSPLAAQQDHITPEFASGTEPRAYRRTTLIVERETLSVFMRRAVAEPVAEPVVTPAVHSAAHPADEEIAPQQPEKNLPRASPEMPNYLVAGKLTGSKP